MCQAQLGTFTCLTSICFACFAAWGRDHFCCCGGEVLLLCCWCWGCCWCWWEKVSRGDLLPLSPSPYPPYVSSSHWGLCFSKNYSAHTLYFCSLLKLEAGRGGGVQWETWLQALQSLLNFAALASSPVRIAAIKVTKSAAKRSGEALLRWNSRGHSLVTRILFKTFCRQNLFFGSLRSQT